MTAVSGIGGEQRTADKGEKEDGLSGRCDRRRAQGMRRTSTEADRTAEVNKFATIH